MTRTWYTRTLLTLALVGCRGSSEQEAPSPGATPEVAARADLPDVLLVTLDTTRADRIGAYGYDKAKTDTLDALAARGRRYDRAYSPLPLTIPSHASIFTGLYPPNHQIRSNGDGTLREEAVTLTERLREAGYHTGASVAAFVTTREWGFSQGFDAYFDDVPTGHDFWHSERPGADVVDDLVAWRAGLPDDGRPVFAWAHLYDPHFPYAPPEAYLEAAEGRHYDGELAYVDDQIARLLEAFDERPTLVVVVGDHGEGLGQHKELTHGLFTYDSTQRVPMLIAGPGIDPAVIDEPASIVDLAPTILATLELPPLDGVDGRVVPGDPPKPVYMESWQLATRFGIAPHRTVVSGDRKLVATPKPELYDATGADPNEGTNLAEQEPDRVAELQAILDGFGFEPPSSGSVHSSSPEVAAQLEALGYVEGTFTGDLTGPLPDPKDRSHMLRLVERAEMLRLSGKRDETWPIYEQLSEEYPEISEFHSHRAQLLVMQGKDEEALVVLDEALAHAPDRAALKQAKAGVLARTGRLEEASILFQEVAEQLPFAPRVRAMAVSTLLEMPEGSNKGIELGMVYLEEHPDDYNVAGLVGLELVERGMVARGLKLLELGILADLPERGVAMHLAAARMGQGKAEEAIALLERELANHPTNFDAFVRLMRVAMHHGDWEKIVQYTAGFAGGEKQPAALAPSEEGSPSRRAPRAGAVAGPISAAVLQEIWHARAQSLFNLKRYEEAREALDAGLKVAPDSSALLVLEANLLKQEGEPEEAVAAFERAKAAKAREDAEAERARAEAASLAPESGAGTAQGSVAP